MGFESFGTGDTGNVASEIADWIKSNKVLSAKGLREMPECLSAFSTLAFAGTFPSQEKLESLSEINLLLLENLSEFSSFDESRLSFCENAVWKIENSAWSAMENLGVCPSQEERFRRRAACSEKTLSWLFSKVRPNVSEWSPSVRLSLLTSFVLSNSKEHWDEVSCSFPSGCLPSWESLRFESGYSFSRVFASISAFVLDSPSESHIRSAKQL